MKAVGLDDVPVVAGGIIPPEDEQVLLDAGCARVYTPKHYDLTAIMRDIVAVVEGRAVQ
jgi:(2R)-ethylmalonyl-CoA mutase